MARIAWIGLGNMGSRMSRHLVAAGHEVTGFDLNPAAVDAATAAGVLPADSLTAAVTGADVIITMLPKGEHVLAVLSQDGGVWDTAPAGALIIDSSTIDVATSRRLHTESAERGFRFVDAPVSGGISGAAAGTLAFMLGGEPETVAAAREIVAPMSGNTFAAGGPGLGLAAKIANNMMLLIDLLANSEGSQLARHFGLDEKVFWEIVSASSGRSWAQQTWYPVPGIVESSAANYDFAATFSAELAAKDIGLALAAGSEAGINLPAAQLVAGQLAQLADEGLAGKDCSLIVKYVDPAGWETQAR